MPDTRPEKVATVSQQLQAGTYEASSDDVAAKLLATRF
jgi:anti-sigma28 factor (negative regulator of flagellin synthesis)